MAIKPNANQTRVAFEACKALLCFWGRFLCHTVGSPPKVGRRCRRQIELAGEGQRQNCPYEEAVFANWPYDTKFPAQEKGLHRCKPFVCWGMYSPHDLLRDFGKQPFAKPGKIVTHHPVLNHG